MSDSESYAEFVASKTQLGGDHGFEPLWLPESLFGFQRSLVEWAIRKGRAAIYADCGLGKSLIALAWAENVARKTGGRVLILTPIAVSYQFEREGEKFGIPCRRASKMGLPQERIILANYERLHLFNAADFAGCVADESSILKHFSGATQKAVTRFMLKMSYRLLCTATPAPNDYVELGTSSEALGELGYTDMLTRFFRQVDSNSATPYGPQSARQAFRMNEVKAARDEKARHVSARGAFGESLFRKVSFRVAQTFGQWRLKGHAEVPFWRWVASWARACRKPSDLGFQDDGFVLPPVTERHHVVMAKRPADGMLFTIPAFGLAEERDERRRTLTERCEKVAELVAHDKPVAIWVQMNAEGDLLEKMIPDAIQVSGSDTEDEKEERLLAFSRGEARAIITKAKIGGWGLNWQHCANVVTFASHSYESYYQAVRRCWRFGQKSPVTVDVISTEGEVRIRESMQRKSAAADEMFSRIVAHMRDAQGIEKAGNGHIEVEVPEWLRPSR